MRKRPSCKPGLARLRLDALLELRDGKAFPSVLREGITRPLSQMSQYEEKPLVYPEGAVLRPGWFRELLLACTSNRRVRIGVECEAGSELSRDDISRACEDWLASNRCDVDEVTLVWLLREGSEVHRAGETPLQWAALHPPPGSPALRTAPLAPASGLRREEANRGPTSVAALQTAISVPAGAPQILWTRSAERSTDGWRELVALVPGPPESRNTAELAACIVGSSDPHVLDVAYVFSELRSSGAADITTPIYRDAVRSLVATSYIVDDADDGVSSELRVSDYLERLGWVCALSPLGQRGDASNVAALARSALRLSSGELRMLALCEDVVHLASGQTEFVLSMADVLCVMDAVLSDSQLGASVRTR